MVRVFIWKSTPGDNYNLTNETRTLLAKQAYLVKRVCLRGRMLTLDIKVVVHFPHAPFI